MAGDGFPFVMQPQEQNQWCWVATAVSVGAHYEPSLAWDQCVWVDDQFGTDDCCVAASQPHCNRPGIHLYVLSRIDHLDHDEPGAVPILPTISTEIAQRRPLTVAIKWNGGGVHFPLINGWVDIIISFEPFLTERYLAIQDPWYGPSTIPYDTLHTKYQGQGTWIYTYLTKP
jgi:hypothetical protein